MVPGSCSARLRRLDFLVVTTGRSFGFRPRASGFFARFLAGTCVEAVSGGGLVEASNALGPAGSPSYFTAEQSRRIAG